LSEFKMPPAEGGKVVAGVILALVIGALFPVIFSVQLSLMMPLILVCNFVMPVLFVGAGKAAVGALVFSMIASSIFFFGDISAIMLVGASVLPGIAVISGMTRRLNFFDQLRSGIITHIMGYMIAVFIANLSFGGDMISKFIDGMRAQFNALPDELILPIVDYVNAMMANLAGGTIAPEYLVTVEEYRNIFSGTMMDVLQARYVEYLPACILTGAVVSGLISVLWGNWRMARKGLATPESFIGMSGWNFPAGFACGVFFIWITGFAFVGSSEYKSAISAYRAIDMLVQIAFLVQALACFDRMLIKRYTGLRARRVLIILLIIGALIMPGVNMILQAVGAVNLLIIIIKSIVKRIDKEFDDDNNEQNKQ